MAGIKEQRTKVKIPDGRAPAKLPSNFLKNTTGLTEKQPRFAKIGNQFNVPGLGFKRRI